MTSSKRLGVAVPAGAQVDLEPPRSGPNRVLSQTERLALHEAGHAVALYLLGTPFECVRIVADNVSAGRVVIASSRPMMPSERVDVLRSFDETTQTRHLMRWLATAFAGPAAVAIESQVEEWDRTTDRDAIVWAESLYGPRPALVDLALDHHWRQVREKLSERPIRAGVKAIANALLACSTLTGAQVEAILDDGLVSLKGRWTPLALGEASDVGGEMRPGAR